MFRRVGKLSLLSSKDDRIKIINERIHLTEKHLMELCSNFASCTRKMAKCRNSYDELAKGFKSYADEEEINESLGEGLKSFTNSLTILADYMDIEVHRMEIKIVNELSQFENICKATRESLRIAAIARDKEVLRQKQMMEIKSKFSANTSATDSELIKAKLEVNRTNKEIDEIINNFEKRKLHDLKQLLTDFVLISIKQHTKALEALTATYYDVSNIDEKHDLKEFQKLMNSEEEPTKKISLKKALRVAHSMDNLDRDDDSLSPVKSKNRLSKSTKNLSTETHTDDDDDDGNEDSDAESIKDDESKSDSEESVSAEEEQHSEESESDIPEKPKKLPFRIAKPKPKTSIGIPKESSTSPSAFGRMVTVTETKGDQPTATPRQAIDCTGKRK